MRLSILTLDDDNDSIESLHFHTSLTIEEQQSQNMTKLNIDIFDIQNELLLTYRQTSTRNILKKYDKAKYFYFALVVYLAIAIPNILFSALPIFYPPGTYSLSKHVLPISYTVTVIAIFIVRKILDYATNSIVISNTPLSKMNRHNIYLRYLHFKDLMSLNETLSSTPINHISDWRSIETANKDKESLLRTPWFIPLVSVTLAIIPFSDQGRVDAAIFLSILIVMCTFAFYAFVGVDEQANIDKFLKWMTMEHESKTTLTREAKYYFISVKSEPNEFNEHDNVDSPEAIGDAKQEQA